MSPLNQIALGMLFLHGHLDPSVAASWGRDQAVARAPSTATRPADGGTRADCPAAACGCPA